ncbi:MAG: pyruvate dehydrogenase (acetyl-transferring) E1 component subunit alpha [Rickettsiaceae bacterium]
MSIEKNKLPLSKSQYIQAYKDMLLLRRFEERCGQLYSMGLIGGFCHLYIGQEAVAAGVQLAKDENDPMITSYRCHGHAILSGVDPKHVLAELLGKETGSSKGKGGSMHLFNTKGHFYGGHGIVGAQVSLGTGIAFAEQYKETNNVCFVFLGDGAINQGQVYESWNMAAMWKLPAVYIIENNEYSMGTSVARSTSVTDLYKKGSSLGIPGYQINGMDVCEVYSAVKQAAEFVRKGNGPIILEMKTYRYRGHSMSDPAKYRTQEEVKHYKDDLDPIIFIKNSMINQKYIDDKSLDKIDEEMAQLMKGIIEFAKESKSPDSNSLYQDVYVE